MSDLIFELGKNSRETIRFSLGEYKGHRFVDLRIFFNDGGEDPAPTRKGLAVSPILWPQFRKALAQVEAAMIDQKWLDKEDLEVKEE